MLCPADRNVCRAQIGEFCRECSLNYYSFDGKNCLACPYGTKSDAPCECDPILLSVWHVQSTPALITPPISKECMIIKRHGHSAATLLWGVSP